MQRTIRYLRRRVAGQIECGALIGDQDFPEGVHDQHTVRHKGQGILDEAAQLAQLPGGRLDLFDTRLQQVG